MKKKPEIPQHPVTEQQKELNDMLSAIVHDFQEPLSTCVSYLQRLSESQKNPADISRDLEVIVDGMRQMQGMINALRRLSSIGNKKDTRLVDLNQIFKKAVEQKEFLAEKKRAVFKSCKLPEIPGSAPLLIELFQHLIDNSLNHSGKDSTCISLDCHHEGPFWHFVFRDDGKGFDIIENETAFRPFFKASHSSIKGAGIGLTICRRIVNSLGGKIWIEKEKEPGAIVHFILPE